MIVLQSISKAAAQILSPSFTSKSTTLLIVFSVGDKEEQKVVKDQKKHLSVSLPLNFNILVWI